MKKAKKIVIGILIGILSICTFVSAGMVSASSAQNDVILNMASLNNEYTKGEEFSVPQATLTQDGETKEATSVVIYPDGTRYKLKDITLSQTGKYVIEYSAVFNNVKYAKTVEFIVSQPLYQVNNNMLGSATYYDNYEILEYDGTTSNLSGVLIDLPSGGEFCFNNVIDFSEKTKMDAFVNFLILPNEVGKKDIENLYFKLTDIHDSENFVIISYHDVDNSNVEYGVNVMAPSSAIHNYGQLVNYSYVFTRSYVKAGAAFQPKVGVEGSIIHKDNQFGYVDGDCSFHGTPSIDPTTALCNGYLRDSITPIALDYESKGVYSSEGLVTDLDSSEYYTDKWTGFSADAAYLSIYAGTYTDNDSAKIFLTDIAGFDLSENMFVDTTSPVLNVDFEGVDKTNLPNGVVGQGYPIFSASALDQIDGAVDVNVVVYYNYNSSNRQLCEIKDDKIYPKRSGLYTIIYEAKDKMSNLTQERYDFTVVTDMSPITTRVEENISSQALVGEWIDIAELVVDNYVERYDVDVSVSCDGKSFEVMNNAFLPTQLGEYVITYSVTDFVGRKAQTNYTVNVLGNRAPVFFEEIKFPEYLISGKSYDLTALSAYSYENNAMGEEVEVKIYLSDKDGRREITGSSFIPNVAASGDDVSIEYEASNTFGVETLTYPRKCYIVNDDNGLDMTKYFIPNGDLTVDAKDTYISVFTETDKSGFTFLNALLSNNVELKFSSDSNYNHFSSVNVYLTDYADESIAIKISFEKDGASSSVSINNSIDKYSLDSSFDNEKFNFYLRFNAFANTLATDYDENVVISVIDTVYGKEFSGFPSGKVYLKVEFDGVTGGSAIKVRELCKQPLNNISKDNIKPTVNVFGEYSSNYKLNTVVELYDAIAGDVLAPTVTFTMSVRDPLGKIVKDVNGVDLQNVEVKNYQIQLCDYGTYTITYNAKDSSGLANIHREYLRVLDDVAPKITLSTELPNKVSVGSTINLASATALDEVDGKTNVFIYIEDSRGSMLEMVGSNEANYKYTFARAGTYIINYLALDNAGNMALITHKIIVA